MAGQARCRRQMDRNLALEVVRVTEAAALVGVAPDGPRRREGGRPGRGRRHAPALNSLAIDGTVVIGEGERDEAPMLYIGEKVGAGGPEDRHRARSAGRHHDHRQGRPERAGRHRAWRSRAASSTRPTSTWTRSRSAAACRTASSISTPSRRENLRDLAKAKKVRGRRPRRLHPRPPAPRRADRQGARGRRAHHADRRRRRRRA